MNGFKACPAAASVCTSAGFDNEKKYNIYFLFTNSTI